MHIGSIRVYRLKIEDFDGVLGSYIALYFVLDLVFANRATLYDIYGIFLSAQLRAPIP